MAKQMPKPNRQKPDRETIRRMLADVEAVTKSRFYEDPDPIASPVEVFRMPEGKPGGWTFAALSGREQVQVLGDYVDRVAYEKRGITSDQMDQVFHNIVVEEKPRERWLDGTGLDGRPRAQTMEELFAEWREDYRAAAEGHRLPPETRDRLIREAFAAFAEVGFLKWKREEIERHGTPAEVVEAERAAYVKEQERISWPGFLDMAAKATDGGLLDTRQDWIDRAAALARLDREGKLTMQHMHDELRRYTGGAYPKAEQPPKQKGRGFERE